MGRRKNNPDLVDELISRRWDESLGQKEFEEKYKSLSSSDMGRVSSAISGMEDEFFTHSGEDDDDDDEDDDEDEDEDN